MPRLASRLFPTLWITVLAGLLLAVDSIAAPGGGSGFGGGGGGGGGVSGGGGGGAGSGGSPVILPVVLAVAAVIFLFGLFKARKLRRRRRRRERVALAAAEAASADADFAAEGRHNRCEIRSGPRVESVGLVNREHDADDRVVVRSEGLHHLEGPIVASPWSDARLRDDAAVMG